MCGCGWGGRRVVKDLDIIFTGNEFVDKSSEWSRGCKRSRVRLKMNTDIKQTREEWCRNRKAVQQSLCQVVQLEQWIKTMFSHLKIEK